jgi:hypothetical protein
MMEERAEPNLPVKFPLLLAQGAERYAVGRQKYYHIILVNRCW